MSEKIVQEAIRDTICELPEFNLTNCVINDWTVYDLPGISAYDAVMNIITSDEWSSVQDTYVEQNRWTIKAELALPWVNDWNVLYNSFRDIRQKVIDKFNEVGTARSAGGQEATTIDRIYALSEIGEVYNRYIPPEELEEALPDFAAQVIGFEVEEY